MNDFVQVVIGCTCDRECHVMEEEPANCVDCRYAVFSTPKKEEEA